jgi:hypothetical protein
MSITLSGSGRVLDAGSFIVTAAYASSVVKLGLEVWSYPGPTLVAKNLYFDTVSGALQVDISSIVADYYRSQVRSTAFITNVPNATGYVPQLGSRIEVRPTPYVIDTNGFIVSDVDPATPPTKVCTLSGDIINDNITGVPDLLTTYQGRRKVLPDDIFTLCTADPNVTGYTCKAYSTSGTVLSTLTVNNQPYDQNRPVRFAVVGPSIFTLFGWDNVAYIEVFSIKGLGSAGTIYLDVVKRSLHSVRLHWINSFAGSESERIDIMLPALQALSQGTDSYSFPSPRGDENWNFSIVEGDIDRARWLGSIRRSGVAGTRNNPIAWMELPTDAGPKMMLPVTMVNDISLGGSVPFDLEFNISLPTLINSI